MSTSKQPQSHYNVIGIGAACIDLTINVSDDFLKHVPGSKGGAQPIEWDELDRILKLSHQSPLMLTGGSSANVIKRLAGLKESCGFISSLGNEALGTLFAEQTQKQNIKGIFATSPFPTCCVLCLITPDGQLTMRFFEGSSQSNSAELLLPDYFRGIKLMHIDAYSLRRPGLVEKSMQLAKQNGALVSIDLSSF